jgi:hypothetical protein
MDRGRTKHQEETKIRATKRNKLEKGGMEGIKLLKK